MASSAGTCAYLGWARFRAEPFPARLKWEDCFEKVEDDLHRGGSNTPTYASNEISVSRTEPVFWLKLNSKGEYDSCEPTVAEDREYVKENLAVLNRKLADPSKILRAEGRCLSCEYCCMVDARGNLTDWCSIHQGRDPEEWLPIHAARYRCELTYKRDQLARVYENSVPENINLDFWTGNERTALDFRFERMEEPEPEHFAY